MSAAVPIFIAAILLTACFKRVDVCAAFYEGAMENLKTAAELCPTLILLMTAIEMFSGSGASQALSGLLEPLTSALGFPAECTPLMLIRPISGSGSLAVLENILSSVPAESLAARTACVMMGATETTLYTIAVYYGAVKRRAGARIFAACLARRRRGLYLRFNIRKIIFCVNFLTKCLAICKKI